MIYKKISVLFICILLNSTVFAQAAGILGSMLVYSNIPDYWKQGLERVEHRNFLFTGMSLLGVYDTCPRLYMK